MLLYHSSSPVPIHTYILTISNAQISHPLRSVNCDVNGLMWRHKNDSCLVWDSSISDILLLSHANVRDKAVPRQFHSYGTNTEWIVFMYWYGAKRRHAWLRCHCCLLDKPYSHQYSKRNQIWPSSYPRALGHQYGQWWLHSHTGFIENFFIH